MARHDPKAKEKVKATKAKSAVNPPTVKAKTPLRPVLPHLRGPRAEAQAKISDNILYPLVICFSCHSGLSFRNVWVCTFHTQCSNHTLTSKHSRESDGHPRWSVLRFGRRCSKVPARASLVESLNWTLFFTMPWQSPCCSHLAAVVRFISFFSFDGRLLLLVVLAGLLPQFATLVIRLTAFHLSLIALQRSQVWHALFRNLHQVFSLGWALHCRYHH